VTPKTSITTSAEALFRFQVVSAVLARTGRGQSLREAVTETAGPHPTFDAALRHVSQRTVYRWLAAWRSEGIEGLEPAARHRCEFSTVLSLDFLNFVVDQKSLDPRASIPELIARARLLGLVAPDESVDRVTAWRAARRLRVETKRRKKQRERDARRFAYPHRMQMVLADGKHFRAGVTRARRVALFFLDDASRLGLDAVVGTSESSALFLRGLYGAASRHGFWDVVFLDNGPGFIAHDTAEAIRKCGSHLVLGTAAYPEGHGKIEKFNQTAEAAVLRQLDRRAEVDADCGALELRLRHYLREVYNHSPHESLDGDTPWQRFQADERPLRFPADDADLRRRFVVFEERRVSGDNTVPLDSIDYEVPVGHVGQKLQLHRHLLDGTVSCVHDGRLVALKPVDLALNAVSRRASVRLPEESVHPLPPSAAELAFRRDLQPIVGPDGGFSEPELDPEEP